MPPSNASSVRAQLGNASKAVVRAGLRSMLRPIGFDVVRRYRMPSETFLGLGQLPIRTVVDVGANRGQFAREILRFLPQARVLCFEPLPDVFRSLQKWATSTAGAVVAYNLALGETNGTSRMQVHVDWDYSSSLLDTTEHAIDVYPYQKGQVTTQVRVARLDDFIADCDVPLIPDILVKVDAQGYDDRVLRGGQETLKRARACIIEINLDSLYEAQGTFRDIFLLLDSLGYTYAGNLDQAYTTAGHVVFIDALFLRCP